MNEKIRDTLLIAGNAACWVAVLANYEWFMLPQIILTAWAFLLWRAEIKANTVEVVRDESEREESE